MCNFSRVVVPVCFVVSSIKFPRNYLKWYHSWRALVSLSHPLSVSVRSNGELFWFPLKLDSSDSFSAIDELHSIYIAATLAEKHVHLKEIVSPLVILADSTHHKQHPSKENYQTTPVKDAEF
ncbi:hypothetical protein TorRG33x02_327330 [Trema orientale]|uniref:Uncharacterized protein n=1 Tax=Trema orientale TaxID=63057 RepID=A0A2P5BAZ9_TREOI|nr:hypothetical protein TorRG33x02_327330 [Trema orientale]